MPGEKQLPATVLVTTLKKQLVVQAGKNASTIVYLVGELEPIINQEQLEVGYSPERLELYLDDLETQAQHILNTVTTLRTIQGVEES